MLRNGLRKHVLSREDISSFEWHSLPIVAWRPAIHAVMVDGSKVPILASTALSSRTLTRRWSLLQQWKGVGRDSSYPPSQEVGFPEGLGGMGVLLIVGLVATSLVSPFQPSVAWAMGLGVACLLGMGLYSWWSSVEVSAVRIYLPTTLAVAKLEEMSLPHRQEVWARVVGVAVGQGADSYELEVGVGEALGPDHLDQVRDLLQSEPDRRGLRELTGPQHHLEVGLHLSRLNIYRNGAAVAGISNGQELSVIFPKKEWETVKGSLSAVISPSLWHEIPLARPPYKWWLPS